MLDCRPRVTVSMMIITLGTCNKTMLDYRPRHTKRSQATLLGSGACSSKVGTTKIIKPPGAPAPIDTQGAYIYTFFSFPFCFQPIHQPLSYFLLIIVAQIQCHTAGSYPPAPPTARAVFCCFREETAGLPHPRRLASDVYHSLVPLWAGIQGPPLKAMPRGLFSELLASRVSSNVSPETRRLRRT